MKKLLLFIPALALMWACNSPGGTTGGTDFELKTFADSASYAQGVLMGQQIKDFQSGEEALLLNSAGIKAGFDQGVKGGESLIPEAELQGIMMKFQMGIQEVSKKKMQAASSANEAEGAQFLAENATKEGVVTTESGLQYKVVRAGTGATPTAADKVQVNYEGRLLNGEIFDSSYKKGIPATFGVGGVIRGWTEALQLMKEGAEYELYVPSQLAYGPQGNQGIEPGSTLIFKVELLKVNPE